MVRRAASAAVADREVEAVAEETVAFLAAGAADLAVAFPAVAAEEPGGRAALVAAAAPGAAFLEVEGARCLHHRAENIASCRAGRIF